MKTYNIALMPGDGTGPEVLREGVKILDTVASRYGITLSFENYDFGGERYMKTGETLPDSALAELKKHHAIFLGAIGHPDVKPGILEVGILLKLRFALDQYINLRPVKLYPNVETPLKDKGPEHVDFVVVRENTGGIYTGMGGATMVGTPNEIATQVMLYSRPVVELRAVRVRVYPQTQQAQAADARAQVQRAHARGRPVGARAQGGRRQGLQGHQAGL